MELDPDLFVRELEVACQEGGMALGRPQADSALAHARLLAFWSKRVNLTAASSPSELARRHYAEGFLAAGLLPAEGGVDVVDVGSGAGFPGIPMAIARPDSSFTLLEPRERRAAFLAASARELGLQNLEVLCSRWEGVGDRRWEVVTMRALSLDPRTVPAHLLGTRRVLLFTGPNMGLDAWLRVGFARQGCLHLPGSSREIQSLGWDVPPP